MRRIFTNIPAVGILIMIVNLFHYAEIHTRTHQLTVSSVVTHQQNTQAHTHTHTMIFSSHTSHDVLARVAGIYTIIHVTLKEAHIVYTCTCIVYTCTQALSFYMAENCGLQIFPVCVTEVGWLGCYECNYSPVGHAHPYFRLAGYVHVHVHVCIYIMLWGR